MRIIGKEGLEIGKTHADRTFRSIYGIGPIVASKAWNMVDKKRVLSSGVNPEYFLWSLVFMKVNGNEATNATLVGGVTRKTFRKWAWEYVNALERCFDKVVRVLIFVHLI